MAVFATRSAWEAAQGGFVLRSEFDFGAYGNDDLTAGAASRSLVPTAGTVTAGVSFALMNQGAPTGWDLVSGVGMRWTTGTGGDWFNTMVPNSGSAYAKPDVPDMVGSTPGSDTMLRFVARFAGDVPSGDFEQRGFGISDGTWGSFNCQDVSAGGNRIASFKRNLPTTSSEDDSGVTFDWIACEIRGSHAQVRYGTGDFDWAAGTELGDASIDTTGAPRSAPLLNLASCFAVLYAAGAGSSYSPVISKLSCYELVR